MTNRKSYIAYQMAQTPVTLNDLEGHFSYLTLFNLLFEKRHVVSSMCVLELESIHVAYEHE